MTNAMELNEKVLENVNGGELPHCPSAKILKQLELDHLVRFDGGWSDKYYFTLRENGVWKNVGSEDMLAYVERTIGKNDPRFEALADYCWSAMSTYDGKIVTYR